MASLVSLIGKSWKSILTTPPLPPFPLQMLSKCITTELHHPLFILCGGGCLSKLCKLTLNLLSSFCFSLPSGWDTSLDSTFWVTSWFLWAFPDKGGTYPTPFSGAHCNYELLVLKLNSLLKVIHYLFFKIYFYFMCIGVSLPVWGCQIPWN